MDESSEELNEGYSTTTLLSPKVVQKFSNFSDATCGEPLVTQRVIVDFTPQDDIDTDFVQKKCCAFWDFVENCPELRGMKVMPTLETYPLPTPTVEETVTPESVTPLPREKTALSVLELVEEQGLIDRIFEAKLPQSHCSLGSRENHENEPSTTPSASKLKNSKSVCKCGGTTPCKLCNEKTLAPLPVNTTWKKIDEWDMAHPKSFDPPGHQPRLFDCEL